ncbi:MAG: hypothetical protein D4R45_00530 [Planctomycetaceae bacterium]|nr:MAG: hypothetical protein D4R45_00530 [Planctomycetaceae bacterium]
MRERGFAQIQEDILRERASVLARTGESVYIALKKLNSIEKVIEDRISILDNAVESGNGQTETENGDKLNCSTENLFNEINREIFRYNKAREYAKLRYHYFIITREAMGLRRHKMVEETYKIPSKKQSIQGW